MEEYSGTGQHKKPSNDSHTESHQDSTPSLTQLLSSGKLVAEAATSALHHETDKVDKGKVAGAAGDLLGAASDYGKLEEKSFGKYVEKAEDYLHQYNSSNSATTTTTTHSSSTHNSSDGSSGGGGGDGTASESGYGDYLKMAQGFMKKN
ncbi:nodulin-related protein 1-like [Magnolia sinica]|uniref:nodulin-related protein 1-like n=1 Tax=Magnolia sinica TaxID=86752 RepID=UPI0026591333|nr:nodulin-related protein 1-like [Magnolia sinica]